MSFRDLKVGDKVVRRIGKLDMPMTVMLVEEDTLRCAAAGTEEWPLEELWTFHRDTGAEKDHELGWGTQFGVTGSVLKKVQ